MTKKNCIDHRKYFDIQNMIFDQHNYTGRPQDLVRFDVIIYDEDRDFNRTAKRDIENVAWSTSINFNTIKALTNTIKLKKMIKFT